MSTLEEQLEKLADKIVVAIRESPPKREPPTQPLMLDPSDKLFEELDLISNRLSEISNRVEKVSDLQKNDHELIREHDRILVRGTETTPSLQETIRRMAKEQTDFIAGIKAEREETKKKLEAEDQARKDNRNKWKWAWIGLGFTMGPKIFWDIFGFWWPIIKAALGIP